MLVVFKALFRGGSRINFRVLQNFTKKIVNNKVCQIKGILLQIILTEAAIMDIMALAWVAKIIE